jgi:PAS domain S-box-containing protein
MAFFAIRKSLFDKYIKDRETLYNFKNLSDNNPAGIIIYQECQIIYSNSTAGRITGYTSAEMLSMHFWDFFHPEFQNLVKNAELGRLSGEQTPLSYEAMILTKKGQEKWIELSVGLTQFKGNPRGIVAFFDITHKKIAQESLKDNHSYYESAIQESPYPIFFIKVNPDHSFSLEELNQTGESLTGMSSADFKNKKSFYFLSQDIVERFSNKI